jgi:hypothetical protein
LAAVQGIYTEIRHNYVAHFNFRKAMTPTAEEIAARQLDFKVIIGTRELINSMYQVLSLNRFAYLPVQYYADSINVAAGGPSGTDIDKLLDLVARHSEAVNMPERQPEFWKHFKDSRSREEIDSLLVLRRKFGLPAA